MKKLILFQSFLILYNFLYSQQYTITQRAPWEWIREEIFHSNMITNTLNTIKWLKENYNQSMEFYNKAVQYYSRIQEIQETPYGLLKDEDVKKFLSKYEESKKIVEKVEEVADEYNKVKQTLDNMLSQYEKTKRLILSDIENVRKSIEHNINYINSNWNFVNSTVKNLKSQTSDAIKILEKINEVNKLEDNEKKKKEFESIKTSLGLLQLQAQQQTNLLLIKLIEFHTQQIERQSLQSKQILDRQYQFLNSMKEKLSKKSSYKE